LVNSRRSSAATSHKIDKMSRQQWTVVYLWEGKMRRILASLVIAAALMSVATSEASAWVCRATGLGAGGWGRSYSIIDAKLWALRSCEHHSAVPVCTLIWCRPGH
jgi:hypothetical protein